MEDALLIASFKGGETQHDIDRVLGIRHRTGTTSFTGTRTAVGPTGTTSSSFTHTRDSISPRSLDPLPSQEEDPAAVAASAPQKEFAPVHGVWDWRFRSTTKLIQ
jgi:hypothetical protein